MALTTITTSIDLSLVKSLLCILVVLTAIFFFLDHTHFNGIPSNEDMVNKIVSRLHLSMATVSTVGYGDVSPKSDVARLVSILAQLMMMLSLHQAIKLAFDRRKAAAP